MIGTLSTGTEDLAGSPAGRAGPRLLAIALCTALLGGAAPTPESAPLDWSRRDAETLVEIIATAGDEGLDPRDYDSAAVERAARLDDPALLDRVATAAAMELAGDYWAGRVPTAQRRDWHIAGTSPSAPVLLARIAAGLRDHRLKATFDGLLPAHDDYRQLRQALAATGAGDEARRAQLRANLERWRWMPRDLGANHVLVNVPAFSLRVTKDGRQIEERPVIVGKRSTPTPQFSAQITGVVLNPWWEVPKSIVAESVGSLLRRNPARAAAQGYVLQRAADGSERVRQRPGGHNALGQMKLVMPNRFAVYLHDTPARGRFDEAERTFSHGCVRVKGAVDFAALLLADSAAWPRARIDRVLAAGETVTAPLAAPLPVYIGYFTAAARAGAITYYGDPYGRDPGILRALDRRAPAAVAALAQDRCPA